MLLCQLDVTYVVVGHAELYRLKKVETAILDISILITFLVKQTAIWALLGAVEYCLVCFYLNVSPLDSQLVQYIGSLISWDIVGFINVSVKADFYCWCCTFQRIL